MLVQGWQGHRLGVRWVLPPPPPSPPRWDIEGPPGPPEGQGPHKDW